MTSAAARYAENHADNTVTCLLCPHHCRVKEGMDGRCHSRGVRQGVLCALGYGKISSAHEDPMEKKPLYHFLPGTSIFSLGGWGCNLRCIFCQNWTISQKSIEAAGDTVTPSDVIKAAQKYQSRSIAYTYNEPLINIEFVAECAVLARRSGLANVLVTNGFIEESPARDILPFIDALNVDIKSMEDDFYRKHCGGELAPVLNFCVLAHQTGCHVEITNLVIPGLNDAPDLFDRLAGWISREMDRSVPLHLSAYHPDYKLSNPPTPATTLIDAARRCKKQLDFVYIGNVGTTEGQNTVCPHCAEEWIRRRGYGVQIVGIHEGHCRGCGMVSGVVVAEGYRPRSR